MKRSLTVLAALLSFAAARAECAELPKRLELPPPFPAVQLQAPTFESLAPGVQYGTYALTTSSGPLSIHVVAVAPHHPSVRVRTVIAHNILSSSGELVSSMARRTRALAGINGDYFDTGKTNRPTNLVVADGHMLVTPRKRYSLLVDSDGMPHFAEPAFFGQLLIGDKTLSLDTLNDLPPPGGGTTLVTPEYGPVPSQENVTLIALTPLDAAVPFTRYRVSAIADNLQTQPAGYYLAVGLAAYGASGVPNSGDTVSVTGDLSPESLGTIAQAIGGGPMILRDGRWFDDPDGPGGPDFDGRNPVSGAAIAPDGTLLLVEIDGRNPFISTGVDRREFSGILRALGATEGICFDGGGSSAIAIAHPGETEARLDNAPSDGVERPVGNGIFVYDDAPPGRAIALAATPGVVHALGGAAIPVHVAPIDAHGHPLAARPVQAEVIPASLGIFRDDTFFARSAGDGVVRLRSGNLEGTIGVSVDASPARLAILPAMAHAAEHGSIALQARAFDARGYPLALPKAIAWAATSGNVDAAGVYHAETEDATITARVGTATAIQHVLVGSHQRDIPFAETAHFATVPRGSAGSLIRDPACAACVQLTFALGPEERAAYALTDIELPMDSVGLSFDVRDDGSGARLRVSVRNALNQQVLINAITLDGNGWRHIVVNFPATVTQPSRLTSIYVIAPEASRNLGGSIVLRNVAAVVAGTH